MISSSVDSGIDYCINEVVTDRVNLEQGPIRLMDFDHFENWQISDELRNDHISAELSTNLSDINRDESLIVFVSHPWLRSSGNFFIMVIFYFS